ncbi:hypothetical protein M501DRAFT_874138 [Patellaria atrata CBS 101060]|uniref:Zn(2)-C6 fungal-type domain-containing protein n=1 Tax=Patellaria atrata CBS 101060 TaxID=1346257 RepID=A0A9P4S984_9PEZI|nr:hypothetical protein M501DRAFT_874138 [Patellaria atrata CBS 101060]
MSKRRLLSTHSDGINVNPLTSPNEEAYPYNETIASGQPNLQSSRADESPVSGNDLKGSRQFLAVMACERCRLKKTRCDEDRPKCGLCKSLGADCNYPEARRTKKDQSLTIAINAIRRLEDKIEFLANSINSQVLLNRPAINPLSPQASITTHSPVANLTSQSFISREINKGFDAVQDAIARGQDEGFQADQPYQPTVSNLRPISFSQHYVLQWPAMTAILPQKLVNAAQTLGKDYVIDIESGREPLPPTICYFPADAGISWLRNLPLSLIKGLCDAYFAVFNRFAPIMDRHHFVSSTLGTALDKDFGYDIESCLLLNVMALGCLAMKAYEEGSYEFPFFNSPTSYGHSHPSDWYEVTKEESPGLRFFNEARRRIGFLICENDLQCCQFYLLSSFYYAQILRPIDSWSMLNRAAVCCMTMLQRDDKIDCDQWEGDMKSRVFWNTLMHETILTQELNLPPSGLSRFEENVPIPKFTPCPRTGRSSVNQDYFNEDDAFFNLHFLAQAAHRIILTRIRLSLYFFSERGIFPTPALVSELHHQLEQWRANLPAALQFDDDDDDDDIVRPPSPAHAVAIGMLKSRYFVAKFHIGRPFLYKAFHAPQLLTDDELEACHAGLKSGMFWIMVTGICKRMKSCQPIKFGWSSQMFGQFLLIYGVIHSPHLRIRQVLSADWQNWWQEMLEHVEYCAKYSPAVAKDLELIRLL